MFLNCNYEALSSHVEPYPERADVFLKRLANDEKEQTWSIHGPNMVQNWRLKRLAATDFIQSKAVIWKSFQSKAAI